MLDTHTPTVLAAGFLEMAANGVSWGRTIGFGAVSLICLFIIGAAAVARSLPKILGAVILAAIVMFTAANLLLLGDAARNTYEELEKPPSVTIPGVGG